MTAALYQMHGVVGISLRKKPMAGVTRLELATSGVTGQRSNQLSYTPAITGATKLASGLWAKQIIKIDPLS